MIGLGDAARMQLTGRVVINDTWHSFSEVPTAGLEDYGVTVAGDLADLCWFRFRDGTQTTADPFLLAKFGADSERPWTADMIGRGIPQVIATFLRNPERFPGEPRLRFEVLGIPLYDPRADSSVGGRAASAGPTPRHGPSQRTPRSSNTTSTAASRLMAMANGAMRLPPKTCRLPIGSLR